MFQGNWKCSSCGGAITELPFEPRGESGLTCKACFIKQKNGETAAPPELEASSSDERGDVPPFDPSAAPVDDATPPPPEFEGAAPAAEKPKFSGDWKCSVCGGAITSLPFEPRSTDGLKCIDCFKKG